MINPQHTIKKEVSIEGIGLHTGNKIKVKFKPAIPNTGINFLRTDLPGHAPIKINFHNLLIPTKSPRRTSIGIDNVEIHTVEHLMSVLNGLSIDNLLIEINGNEIPGLDGSAINFLELFEKVGLEEQKEERKYYHVREVVYVEEDGAMIIAVPADEFRISYTLNYNHPLLSAQYLDISINPESFKKEIAPARTFCLEEESQTLRDKGLGKGANYENTLVVGKNGIIKNKLRFPNEFVRHKILDLIGDLYLFDLPLKAHIIALRSGHVLNLNLIRKIQQQRERMQLGGIGAGCLPQGQELDAQMIMKILPHRYPFLLVDKIISLEKGKRAVGIKNVTINDNFFTGHFPGKPVMPGVLIIEALAQVGGVMMLSPEENRGKLAYFLAIDNVKFRKTVVPGDQLVFEVQVDKIKSKTGRVCGKAFVDGKLVTEADLMFALVEYT
ncbi:MAG: bifunctional UDP-3-O-[3-hydroxymyristoyl] N-acetylglucosamine deacetylase/3-hydroxyacyl-ACP dehydratase [Candidatus Omnitrophota bacterium]